MVAIVLSGTAMFVVSVATCWMYGASLYYKAAAAYRRGDKPAGDRLTRRANRWTFGAGRPVKIDE